MSNNPADQYRKALPKPIALTPAETKQVAGGNPLLQNHTLLMQFKLDTDPVTGGGASSLYGDRPSGSGDDGGDGGTSRGPHNPLPPSHVMTR